MLPDAQMVWLNPDLKVYATEIHLDGESNGLRTGMSCRASIVVDEYEDVVYIPVQVERSRPGILLQVMSRPHLGDDLRAILGREGISHGIRRHVRRRRFLRRELLEVDSPWGKVKVKKVLRPNAAHFFLPEYEACRKIAREHGLPLKDIYAWVMAANRKT